MVVRCLRCMPSGPFRRRMRMSTNRKSGKLQAPLCSNPEQSLMGGRRVFKIYVQGGKIIRAAEKIHRSVAFVTNGTSVRFPRGSSVVYSWVGGFLGKSGKLNFCEGECLFTSEARLHSVFKSDSSTVFDI